PRQLFHLGIWMDAGTRARSDLRLGPQSSPAHERSLPETGVVRRITERRLGWCEKQSLNLAETETPIIASTPPDSAFRSAPSVPPQRAGQWHSRSGSRRGPHA